MGCTNNIDGIVPVGNTDASPGARYGWYYPLPASLIARWDTPLTTLLNVGRCEVLLHHLALVFFTGKRPKDGELREDNSSSMGVLTLVGMMGDELKSNLFLVHFSA